MKLRLSTDQCIGVFLLTGRIYLLKIIIRINKILVFTIYKCHLDS